MTGTVDTTDRGHPISAGVSRIEEELKTAEGVLERNKDASSPDELRGAFEKLQGAAHKLAEAMYKQSGGGEPPPAGGPEGGGGAKPDDVIDAEFEDKS